MTTTAPVEHLQESLKLEADAEIDLFEIQLKGISTIFRFWNGPTRDWSGWTWEGLACQMQGDGKSGENDNIRPSLSVMNPEKVFGLFAAQGYFELATVIRRRLLQQHFLNNVNIYEQRVWLISRVVSSTSQTLQVELRNPTDIPNMRTPRRSYTPPDYPFVKL